MTGQPFARQPGEKDGLHGVRMIADRVAAEVRSVMGDASPPNDSGEDFV